MAAKKRKQYTADFKAKVALAACKGNKTANQLASEYSVGPAQISQWKSTLLNQSSQLFERTQVPIDQEQLTAPLYQEIGRLKMELTWLQKKNLKLG